MNQFMIISLRALKQVEWTPQQNVRQIKSYNVFIVMGLTFYLPYGVLVLNESDSEFYWHVWDFGKSLHSMEQIQGRNRKLIYSFCAAARPTSLYIVPFLI